MTNPSSAVVADSAVIRVQLRRNGLDRAALGDEPMVLFALWLQEWQRAVPLQPRAFVLATIDPDGRPTARCMDLGGADRGLVFFTDQRSPKAAGIACFPLAAACFDWASTSNAARYLGIGPASCCARTDSSRATNGRGAAPIRGWRGRVPFALGRLPSRSRNGGILARTRRWGSMIDSDIADRTANGRSSRCRRSDVVVTVVRNVDGRFRGGRRGEGPASGRTHRQRRR